MKKVKMLLAYAKTALQVVHLVFLGTLQVILEGLQSNSKKKTSRWTKFKRIWTD